jgi:photosystem II stability/assembly factor-like uncharacterized protein
MNFPSLATYTKNGSVSPVVVLLVVILMLFSLSTVPASSQRVLPSFNIDDRQNHSRPSIDLSSAPRNAAAVQNISTSGEQSQFEGANGLINSPIDWSAIGPKDIPDHLKPEGPSYNESGSGKVLAFAVDYSDPSTMYAGAAGLPWWGPYSQSGIYKTNNGGTSWYPVDNGVGNPAVTSLWLDQSNPEIVLAATPSGIYRTENGGSNWTLVYSSTTYAISSQNGTLYAGGVYGLISSGNAGETWQVLTSGDVTAIGLGPDGAVYAGTFNGQIMVRENYSAPWVTETAPSDSGPAWIEVDPEDPGTAYGVFILQGGYVTHNWGKTWEPLGLPTQTYIESVAIDSTDPNTVYIGGDFEFFVSKDGGQSFTPITWDLDTWSLQSWPGKAGTLLAATDQGLFLLSDYGYNATPLSGNLTSTIATDVSVVNSSIFVDAQDWSPIISFDGGNTWNDQWMGGAIGEDGSSYVDPYNSSYVFILGHADGLEVSTNGGQSFITEQLVGPQEANFGSTQLVAFDPANESTVYYAGSTGIFVSHDDGITWENAGFPFNNTTMIAIDPYDPNVIFVGTGTDLSSPTFYARTTPVALYYSVNGGDTWSEAAISGDYAGYYPSGIAFDPYNLSVVLLAVTNGILNGGGLYLSTNGGENFSPDGLEIPSTIPGGDDYYSGWGILVAPSNNVPDGHFLAFVSTNDGIFMATTPYGPWRDIRGNVVPYSFTGMALEDQNLYASTVGEGVVRLNLSNAPIFNITFAETGLSYPATWGVSLDGITEMTSGKDLTFNVSNGRYNFTIITPDGYGVALSAGGVNVDYGDVNLNISFVHLKTYNIEFVESGLPSGTTWTVTLNGTAESSAKDAISFLRPNGTYGYSISSSDPNYTPYSHTKNVTVNGSPVIVNVTFVPTPPAGFYLITFEETGLSLGSVWYVTLNGTTENSTSNNIIFMEPNGTYSFHILPPPGTTASPISGTVTVTGSNVTETVHFASALPKTYEVTFSETGLPLGSSWSVTLNGTTRSSTGNISFTVPNGTYSYSIGSVPGYSIVSVLGYNESSGYLTVDGYNLSYPVTFVRVISKGFLTGSIYPLNASISINGTIYQAVNGKFNISLNPGTYEVKVSAPGYATYATNITVSSSSVSRLPIQSLTKMTKPSSFSILLIIVIAVIIMAAVVATAVLTITRNRRKKS